MIMQFELVGTGKSHPLVRTACVWLVATIGMAVAGCGQGSFRSGPDYPVKGKVLLADGNPCVGQVVFVSSETALSYVGQIGDDGEFALKQGDRVGAPAGSYKVRIDIPETSLPKRSGKTPSLPFPPRYRDEDVSKLAATVKADSGTENTFEFKLSN